jgi:hypothetical protein
MNQKVMVNFNQYVYIKRLAKWAVLRMSTCHIISYSKGLKDKNVQIFVYKFCT